MTKKRKNIDFQAEDTLYSKRSRSSQIDGGDDDRGTAQSKIDPTYGQRGAFPGLDGASGDDDLFYGPASDGLEYLRMVRSEAKTVPKLLVAPSSAAQTRNEDIYREYGQGFYADGAYTATPLPSSDSPYARPGQQDEEDIDPQEAYYTSLCTRFAALSQLLQSQAPSISTDPPKASLSYLTTRQWRNRILHTTPTMALLAQLPQEMIIHGLTNLESTMTSNNLRTEKGKNIGAWAWGLLARCRDVGQMGSDEVGVLRDLGKRAVWLLRRIAAGEAVGAGAEDVEDEGGGEESGIAGGHQDGGGEGDLQGDIAGEGRGEDANGVADNAQQAEEEDGSLVEARQRMLSSLPPSSQAQDDQEGPGSTKDAEATFKQGLLTASQLETETSVDQQIDPSRPAFDQTAIHATLDMLVTVIGECYGQRDLLNGRLLWDEIDGFH